MGWDVGGWVCETGVLGWLTLSGRVRKQKQATTTSTGVGGESAESLEGEFGAEVSVFLSMPRLQFASLFLSLLSTLLLRFTLFTTVHSLFSPNLSHPVTHSVELLLPFRLPLYSH